MRPRSSPPPRPRRAPGRASPARARSAAACPAGCTGRSSTRRRTRPSSGSPTAGGPSPRCRRTRTPKSSCASITSRPLLTSVAELIVMTGPMFQVGWASACSGVTSVSSSRRRPRNGPPLAVRISRRTSARLPERRHCASAECSESTGTIWSGRCTAARTSGPPATSDSLFASASVRPARSAASVGARPERPDHAVEHHVARPLGQLGHRLRPGEDLRDPELTGGVAAPRRLGVEGQLQVLGGRWPSPRRRRRRPAPAPARRAGRRCRRRRRARPPGTGPGCAARCRSPACRSTRSSRAARSRGRSPLHCSPDPDRHDSGQLWLWAAGRMMRNASSSVSYQRVVRPSGAHPEPPADRQRALVVRPDDRVDLR